VVLVATAERATQRKREGDRRDEEGRALHRRSI
jgi:hypothetical protein